MKIIKTDQELTFIIRNLQKRLDDASNSVLGETLKFNLSSRGCISINERLLWDPDWDWLEEDWNLEDFSWHQFADYYRIVSKVIRNDRVLLLAKKYEVDADNIESTEIPISCDPNLDLEKKCKKQFKKKV